MIKKSCGISIGLIIISLFYWQGNATDRYQNFAELARYEKEGVDFRFVLEDRKSPVTVLAIHGGRIESGTSELARAIAELSFNLYLFEGIKPAQNALLHITSAHFDEPRAQGLAKRSKTCISVHGFKGEQRIVCIGGGSVRLRKKIARALSSSLQEGYSIKIEEPCQAFPGEEDGNIVNLCTEKGIQLELSRGLRETLLQDQELLKIFKNAVHSAISH